MREFLVDINKNIEIPKYELVICKLNEEPLQELHNIEDFEIKSYFTNIDEISFKVPFYITEDDGSKVENELYDLVDGSMMVLVNNMKYFILTKPEIRTNEQTGEIYKSILGFSREYELAQKRLVGYSGVSRKIYDMTNAKDENGLEIGFLNYIERTTSWQVGYVNSNILTKYRYLEFPKATILQAFQEVQKTFGCLFRFNTKEKIIDVYEAVQLGTNKGLYISDKNFINSLNQTINHDDIKTRLYLYGKDNVSIQSINITGQPYIENYDFFKNTKYMTQSLIDALNDYESYISNKEGVFNGYLSQLNTLNDTLTTKKIELATLITELRVIESNLDIAISTGQSTATYKSQQTTKIGQINNKQLEIDGVIGQINSVYSSIDDLNIDISLNNHLTEIQARELDPFIREDEYSDSNYSEENLQELFDDGKNVLNRISHPSLQFNVDVEDFLNLVEGQHVWDRLILGDLVNLEHEEIGFNYEVRLIGYVHNPDSNRLSLIFSNKNSVDDANIELKDLLEGITTTASTVDFNKYKWDKGEQADLIINEYVNSALNLAKQQILKADGQKPMIDERGIWLIKENPDGTVENGQMRLIHNCLAITNDNWNSIEVAVSHLGINANLIRGKLGQFAQIDANQITVGGEEKPLLDYIAEDLSIGIEGLDEAINSALGDDKLTTIEANSIKLALDKVVAESSNILSVATSLGITTEQTNYQTSLNILTNNLNDNWLGKTYPLAITTVQRTEINNQFKDLESKKTILVNKITEVRAAKAYNDAKDYTDNNALKQNFYYNRTKITDQEGIEVYDNLGNKVLQMGGIDTNNDGVKDNYGFIAKHTDGTYSAMSPLGFLKKYAHGDAKYLNDIWVTTFITNDGNTYNQPPPPNRIYVPNRFKGRQNSTEIILMLSGLSSTQLGMATRTSSTTIHWEWAIRWLEIHLEQTEVNLNPISGDPYIDITPYSLASGVLADGTSKTWADDYRRASFTMILIGV